MGEPVKATTQTQSVNINDKGDIPEGFFDDPVMDAKARGVEYKVRTVVRNTES